MNPVTIATTGFPSSSSSSSNKQHRPPAGLIHSQKAQRGAGDEAVSSSGYGGSQDGDHILTVAANYLSRLNPAVPHADDTKSQQASGGPSLNLRSAGIVPQGNVGVGSDVINARKISSSQFTQVSDYDGTVSGIYQLNSMRQHTTPSPGIEEIGSKTMPVAISRQCLSPQCGCCQRSEILLRINEELLQHKLQIEEQNRNLSEEIQVSRRFYQGTLADLTAQLSIAENRIKYLHEVVNTQEEALSCLNKEKSLSTPNVHQNGASTKIGNFSHPNANDIQNRLTKSMPNSPRGLPLTNDANRSTASSTTSSVTSEPPRTRLNLKNIVKFKEQLMERNQTLKTDIELLKYKTDVPRPNSVSSLNNKKELPAIKSNRRSGHEGVGGLNCPSPQSSIDAGEMINK